MLPIHALLLSVVCSALFPGHAEAASAWPPAHAKVRFARGPVPEEATLLPPLPGFHEQRQPIYGVLITGAVMSGGGGLLIGAGLKGEADDQRELALRRGDYGNGPCCSYIITDLGIAHLLVGIPLLLVGSLYRRSVYVPNQSGGVRFTPLVSENRVGAAFSLSF